MTHPRTYAAAIAKFADQEDCSPVDEVVRCIEIARRFGKTTQQVSKDINRVYIASYTLSAARDA
jgi:hypothetical protein